MKKSYEDFSIDNLLEGVRECCRFFNCTICPLSAFGTQKCPMPFIQRAIAVVIDGDFKK